MYNYIVDNIGVYALDIHNINVYDGRAAVTPAGRPAGRPAGQICRIRLFLHPWADEQFSSGIWNVKFSCVRNKTKAYRLLK